MKMKTSKKNTQKGGVSLVVVSGEPDGSPEKVAGLLSGYLNRPTRREQWLAVCQRAAMLERNGSYAQASVCWLEAQSLTPVAADRHWCESRARWCLRVVSLQGGRDA